MKLVFVHGWSVTSTDTYGELPQALTKLADAELKLDIQHIHLGRYISFNDEVTLEDISIAFEAARLRELGDETFSVITHSTGGPVIRAWLERYYGRGLIQSPLNHLIMLAPANHGSALAQIGKSRVSRLKAWFDGVEPGQRVLDWLELGSDGQHELNLHWLNYSFSEAGLFPFVLTGETIDTSLYDYMNSYTAEAGSDGVVRSAAANMNFSYIRLTQEAELTCMGFEGDCVSRLTLAEYKVPLQQCAFEIIPRASHSQGVMGIMASVTRKNASKKRVVSSILDCLSVGNSSQYADVSQAMVLRTDKVKKKQRYSMLVVRVTDDLGHKVTDFDLYLLSGTDFNPGKLPKGFMLDKQKNSQNSNCITLYLDTNKLLSAAEGKMGFKIVPRPDSGFSYYRTAEYHCEPKQVSQLIKPDQTTLVDIVLKRHIHQDTFTLVSTDEAGAFDSLAGMQKN
ncbi:MAG: phospholipase [Shewanella sp.]|nr:MAG: phospholipase [Shewanella sp.]